MHRRNFLQSTTGSLFVAPWASLTFPETQPEHKTFLQNNEDLVDALIRENDRNMPALLKRQQLQADHPNYGGFANNLDLYHAMSTASYIQRIVSAYVDDRSTYFHDPSLLTALEIAADFLLRVQHDDGTIDLITTNFHSTPDTAFVVEPLCLAYGILAEQDLSETQAVRDKLEAFLMAAGKALTVGGIHTPNHRWVVSMALARLFHLFGDTRYKDRAEQWLSEGIDIDPDGQYTERSTHVYSPLTNRCLITIARLLEKSELYEPVRKNLEMTLFYLHPDGEIATEASRRQDQYQTGTLQRYYYAYRYMALKDQNGRFAKVTRMIPKLLPLSSLLQNLAYFQEDRFLAQELGQDEPLPQHYEKVFSHSGLVRIRRNQYDASIISENPTFFTFQHESAVLQAVRLASAFFGKGQFEGAAIEKQGEHYLLQQTLSGPYYQPHDPQQIAPDGDWHKMPRSLRKQSEVQQFQSSVTIQEVENGVKLEFAIAGTEGVPFAVELGFKHGGSLSGVKTLPGNPDSFLLEEGYGLYSFQGKTIRFGPGRASHDWTQLRGALPKLPAMRVYLTGYSPISFSIYIEAPA